MSDKVALVTGTSSGIGLWTAVGLAKAGLRVIATMRTPREIPEFKDLPIEVRPLDVTSPSAATAVMASVLADHGRLDILVNNAGQGSVATLEQLDDAALQAQLDVNYLGVARLTRLALPAMRERGQGRVVTVTSVGGTVGQPFADAYCGAKFAVEGLMQSLAPVAARFGVDVSIVEPAAVGSEFVANVGDLGATRDDPYAGLLAAYLRRSEKAFAAAQKPQDAAAVVVEAATTANPRFRWQTSPGASAFAGLSLADLDGSRVLAQTATWLD